MASYVVKAHASLASNLQRAYGVFRYTFGSATLVLPHFPSKLYLLTRAVQTTYQPHCVLALSQETKASV